MPDKRPDEPPVKLPEEFAPTGPRLSRFPTRPAPPMQPGLLADEARFATRLALLAGATELAAWAWLFRSHGWVALAAGALRLARPLWAKLGTRAPRPAVAFALLSVALLAQGATIITIGGVAALTAAAALSAALPALGDLAATCIGDSVTLERRAAAYARLDMGQGLGCALGIAIAGAAPGFVPLAAAGALLLAGLCVADLHDRGTPRSSWPTAAFKSCAVAPLASRLLPLTLATGALAGAASGRGHPLASLAALAPLAGMFIAARVEPRMRNAIGLPAAVGLLSAVAFALGFVEAWRNGGGEAWTAGGSAGFAAAVLALGAACTALPASVSRGAGEMERPLVSSLAWAFLTVGFGIGRAVL